MEKEVRVQLTIDDIVHLWRRHRLRFFASSQHRHAVITWALLLVMTAFLPPYLAGQTIDFAHYLIASMAIVFLLWSNLAPYSKRNALTYFNSEQGRKHLGPFIARITEERIVAIAETHSAEWKWPIILAIECGDRGLFIKVDERGDTITIPRHAFADEASFKDFARLAQEYWTQAQSPPTRCPACGYDLRAIQIAGCPECGWQRERVAH